MKVELGRGGEMSATSFSSLYDGYGLRWWRGEVRSNNILIHVPNISTIKHMSLSKGKCLGICLDTLHMHVHVYIEVCKDR